MMELSKAIQLVNQEYDIASQKFGPMCSPHEGLAIIEEEFEELKWEVFSHHNSVGREDRMCIEAKHLATMAIRFMVDLT